MFEFWQTLARLTHNLGINPPKPGKNLLDGWETAPAEKQWLFAQFLAIDANFRLVQKNVSSETVDPGLSRGWGYFVEETAFKGFLQEKSTCTSHNAVNLAETKNSRGLAATGAGTVDCSRHNFKRPCAVGDLQKGEKYINMDYLFFSTMQHSEDIVTLNISYDIACQWSKNLWDRLSKYSSHLRFGRDGKKVTFLIPKFHLPAHIAACQTSFSHNLIKGMGRTDSEAPERGWANINLVATSTREMGPGSRRDTLDDHFGDYNWKKVTNFGISLLNKIKIAIPERDQHQYDFNEFHNALVDERPREITQWKDAIEQWEADHSNPNPFKTTTITMMQAAVRLKLSQQEAGDLEKGLDSSLHADISPSILISSGMDLEDQQYRLWKDQNTLGAHATDLQLAKLQERSNALLQKVEHWCQVQLLYMPMAYESLDDLRRQLRLRSHLYKFKDANIRGQRANMRASAVLKKVELTVTTAADRYRRAWKALKVLAGVLDNPSWEAELPELQPTDIRGMSEGDSGQSEGNRTLSWIWKARGVGAIGDDNESILSEALRIEWCKLRARASRWAKEVELLQEEMRRVAEFLSWHAAWWEEQAVRRTGLTAAEQEGMHGYARRQAAMRRAMRDRFLALWSVVSVLLQLLSPVAP
ncbi:uncharacterized protein HD556DRAFT_1310740 [Suillus plorans]|uniref:CxC2-like cysteine cluster KDZ transposase-associated domain-containing protein n=1 Tax=Suillus plorans TaxID=116603 RepID=A0A9P7DEL7_9AGAM|nr:uncharacterized protein HD556DRAFT_1310740 [Suillus plorans]KAG1790350.1 hypothetical protein HD556DRAFT_1310740 [Suillus plorans]